MTDALICVPAELIIAIASLCRRSTRRALAETNRRHCQLVQPLVFQEVNISSVTQLRQLANLCTTRDDIGRALRSILIKARSLVKKEGYDADIKDDITDLVKQLLNSSRVVNNLIFDGLGGTMLGLGSGRCYLVDSLDEIVSVAVGRGLKTLRIIDSMVKVWTIVNILYALGDHDMDVLELVCCAPTLTSGDGIDLLSFDGPHAALTSGDGIDLHSFDGPHAALTSGDGIDLHSFDANNVVRQVSDYLDQRGPTKKLHINSLRLVGCDLFVAIIAAYVNVVGHCRVVRMLFYCEQETILSWYLDVMAKENGLVEGLEVVWMFHPGVPGVGRAKLFISGALVKLSQINYGLRRIMFTVVDCDDDPVCLFTVSLKEDYVKVMRTDGKSWGGIGGNIGRSAFWDATTKLHIGYLENGWALQDLFLGDHPKRDGWSARWERTEYYRLLVEKVAECFAHLDTS
ncbi:hypothetical protein K435DRAFT_871357 [Dendrothele bispora CBS 962.96]|uniref:Uncharacterized protein n=1 Tax=Dendrothele bispora (strain CBS 962.96) TaxID=1314807 RepID=A0A4S8L493_DENBC|nr:hypothetical protein K435DRAFT_871357 [Dendrothele bispora CBS 962.96]